MKINWFSKTVIILCLCIVLIYLFAEAPSSLIDSKNGNSLSKQYSVEEAFKMLANENAKARILYTKAIVGVGKDKNLKYNEHWKEKTEEAGPLPALLLRETALEIERFNVGLGLYLGSDFPISSANLYKGMQAQMFKKIREERKPIFYFELR